MANLSNINNKFIVTDGGQALINQTAAGFNPDADDLIVGNLSGNTGITIASGSSAGNYGSIYFADGAGSSTPSKAGFIRYEQNTSEMTIGINAVEKIAIDISGNTTIQGTVQVNGSNATVINASDPNFTVSDTDTNYRGAMRWLTSSNVLEFFTRYGGTYYTNNLVLDRGNVGIGTTSPDILGYGNTSRALAVQGIIGTASAQRPVVLNLAGQRDDGTNGYVSDINFLNMASNGTTVNSRAIIRMSREVADNSNKLEFWTANAGSTIERMRIRSSGTIGIGSGGFDSQMLTIAAGTLDGAIYATSTDANCFASFRDNSSNVNVEFGAIGNAHVFRKDAAESMRIDGNGNVGIGITLPATKLDVSSTGTPALPNASGTTLSSGSRFRLSSTGGPSATLDMGIGISGKSWLQSRDVTDFSINYPFLINPNGGNVGIGTSSPSSKLHVKGDMVTIEDPSGGFKMELSADANPVTIMSDNRTGAAYGEMAFIAGNGSDANDQTRMIINSSGNVGIGITSPNTKLDVSGTTGTRNRNTQGSSVYETSLYFIAAGNATTNVSIDTTTAFPPIASGGFILVEVSASGYGNSGSNGLVFSYISGGYGGHYGGQGQPYHPVEIIANTMQAGSCTFYYPNSTTVGIAVTTTNSAGLNGVMRVKVTSTY